MNFFHLILSFSIVEVINSSVIKDASQIQNAQIVKTKDGFEYFSSYKIPLNADPNEELIALLKNTSSRTFHDSLFNHQAMRHECPGCILFFNDGIHEICAEFRASKPSIDPNSFSKNEKFAFIERVSDAGMFVNVEKTKTANKKHSETIEKLKIRSGIAGVAAISHFCRDALRIVAGVLDSKQITWLLTNSTPAILNSSEFLNQLSDFSMFENVHLIEAAIYGQYDWFQNEKALMTLKPAALLGFFEHLHFDLTDKQLELLNKVRPISELFECPEFVASPFAWQITAGTKYFAEKHINIDQLIRIISNLSSAGEEIPDVFKQFLFAFYIHFEFVINAHMNGIINASNSVPLYGNPDGSAVDEEDFESFRTNIDAIHEQYQLNMLKFHMDKLETIFTSRHAVIEAVMSKISDFDSLRGPIKHLFELLTTPSLLMTRKAMVLVEAVKGEFEQLNLNELLRLIKESSFDIFRKYALILAYFDLKYAPIRIPYRNDAEPCSSLKMVHKLRSMCELNHEQPKYAIDNKPSWLTKWPRFYLMQQANDFKLSEMIQLQEFKDEENIQNTLDTIINGLMIFCDHEGFSADFVNHVKDQFPGNCENFLNSVDNFRSLEYHFEEFARLFRANAELYKEASTNFTTNSNVTEMIMVGYYEGQLMAVIQNLFKIEMVELLAADSELLSDFSDFAYLLTRNQVKELLEDEKGRKLLAENKNLVHNLPTYEDFKVTDLKPLKLQAQYATMVRTLSILPLLVSLKSDDYLLNDPLGLSMRLFSFDGSKLLAGQANGEIFNNLWRIVPVQAVVENWRSGTPELQQGLARGIARIRNYLINSKEVKGKPLESIRTVLHWIILQEIRFLEGFTLINSQESEKFRDAVEVTAFFNHTETLEREYLLKEWLISEEIQKIITNELGGTFTEDLIEILNGPVSQIRAASLLTGREIMDKNIRFLSFNGNFVGFDDWVNGALQSVRLGLSPDREDVPVKTEVFEVSGSNVNLIDDNIKEEVEDANSNNKSTALVNYKPEKEDNAHTNIPQYRQYIEENCGIRREKLSKLLEKVDKALGNTTTSDLWKNRIELLGVLSADGFILSPSYNRKPNNNLNVTIHERIIHRKLLTLANMVECQELPDALSPEKLALTTIRFAPSEEPAAMSKDVEEIKSSKKSAKNSKNKKRK